MLYVHFFGSDDNHERKNKMNLYPDIGQILGSNPEDQAAHKLRQDHLISREEENRKWEKYRNEHLEKTQRQAIKDTEEWRKGADAMAQPVEKAQRQESVNERTNHQDFRALSLELARFDIERNRLPGVYGGESLIKAADRFYTYITKGE